MARSGIIALLTDFGLRDPYVGVMKAVVLGIAPHARIVDLTHAVAPQSVTEANFALLGSYEYFPDGTVLVIVVDPGVGSSRRILAARAHGRLFVAPDNGVLTGVIADGDEVRAVENRDWFRAESISNTFHGRDIFAPVAAHLVSGSELARVGPHAKDWVKLDRPGVKQRDDGGLVGTVIHVDTFGNLISNVRQEDLESLPEERRVVTFRSQNLGPPVTSYASVPVGTPLTIVDSFGFLEIAINSGHASRHFNGEVGDPIRIG